MLVHKQIICKYNVTQFKYCTEWLQDSTQVILIRNQNKLNHEDIKVNLGSDFQVCKVI